MYLCRFGSAHNADCVVPCASMLDFYNGGGVDVTCLGAAEVHLACPVPGPNESTHVLPCHLQDRACPSLVRVLPERFMAAGNMLQDNQDAWSTDDSCVL